jgi:hypothetical protein
VLVKILKRCMRMAKKTEVAPQELEIHIPVTIHTSETVNLNVMATVLNDTKLVNTIRSAVLGGLTLPPERRGKAENVECEIGPIAIGPKGVHTRVLRISGGLG